MRCDCHVHVVGPAGRYPQVPSRTYLADLAPLTELRRRGAARGITRFVIVQASFYGTDNTLLLESLDALGGDGRGVAVSDPAAPPATLTDYARRGVRGLRLNLYSTASCGDAWPLDEAFAGLAAVAQTFAWHVEVIASLAMLARHAEVLARGAVPVVIDHYGLPGDATPQSADARRLLELFRLPHVWIKLSAPYRVSPDPLATGPNQPWLDAILDSAAERCVWGSDWPHTPPSEQHRGPAMVAPYRPLSYQRLVDDFLAVLASDALADRIMRDNPARLYGF
jgi:predicted TIM-barrel fold metal-dependent hydrolase